MNKTIIIFSLIFLPLFLGASSKSILSLEDRIETVKNPFKKHSKMSQKKEKKELKIYAIIGDSFLYKERWYQKGDKIEDCMVLDINQFDASFVCKNKKIKTIKVNKVNQDKITPN